jgi:hypothetical protein
MFVLIGQCYAMLLSAAAAAVVSVHRADWLSGIIDQLLLPGQKEKGLMEKASLKASAQRAVSSTDCIY